MSSRCRAEAALLAAALAAGCGRPGATGTFARGADAFRDSATSTSTPAPARPTMPARPTVLRVCADPNNLPFSDRHLAGFENRIAALLARDLHARLEYTWWAQRRGFIRNTLKARSCDLVVGVPSSFELAMTSAPYYRSSYVFVYRRDRGLDVRSFDDPALKRLRIGVQLVGNDGNETPPAHALAARGLGPNIVGYTLYGDYSRPHPPSAVIDAVAKGDVDVAVAWGPLAGYFARQSPVPLTVVPVSPQADLPYLPFVFDIAMGVRRGETPFLEQIDGIIRREQPAIDRILADYGVPRLDAAAIAAAPAARHS